MDIASSFPHKQAYLEDGKMIAFTALEQSKGRGQGTNQWVSIKGGNLYVTFLVVTKTAPYWASLIAGLSLC